MATPMGLFGLIVHPGDPTALDDFRDVRITNIAFGESVEGSGRSVVKVHRRRPLNPLEEDELNSEEDDEDDDEEDDEDEEDDDQEEEDEQVDAQLENGDDEEDGDSEDDDSFGSDSDDGMIEEEFVVCSLYPTKIEQVKIDLQFTAEEPVAFSVTGDNPVELTGYYLSPDPFDEDPDSDELDSEMEDDEYDSDIMAMIGGEVDSEENYDDEELDSDEDIQIEEIDEDVPATKPSTKKSNGINSKKRVAEAESGDISSTTQQDDDVDVSQLSKNQRKKLNKKMKTDDGSAAEVKQDKVEVVKKDPVDGKVKVQTVKNEVTKKDGKETSKKTTLPSGLIVEDRKIGTGPQAKAGNRVSMRYVGRLTSGKQFDSNTKGKPFAFKLGKGEVIAGWDEGVKGMQVGGERRLTCPPKLAYGTRGAPPDIPGNSTLVFDVKLVEIK